MNVKFFNFLKPSVFFIVMCVFCLLRSLPLYADGSLRDPTTPLSPSKKTESLIQLTLSGISSVKGRRIAIVNGQRVKVGAEVDGAIISEINDNSIKYYYKGKSHTLIMRLSLIQ